MVRRAFLLTMIIRPVGPSAWRSRAPTGWRDAPRADPAFARSRVVGTPLQHDPSVPSRAGYRLRQPESAPGFVLEVLEAGNEDHLHFRHTPEAPRECCDARCELGFQGRLRREIVDHGLEELLEGRLVLVVQHDVFDGRKTVCATAAAELDIVKRPL